MKFVILTSDGLRHRYLCECVSKEHDLLGVVVEAKGKYYQDQKDESALIQKHFESLQEYEEEYFGGSASIDCDVLRLDRGGINDISVVDWVSKKQPDAIILFGTGILGAEWLDRFSKNIINIHLGYSPFYRGSATLFWPFVKGDLDKVGATIHLAVEKVDAGGVLSIVKPKVEYSDNYYDITNKTIKAALENVASVAEQYLNSLIHPTLQDLRLGSVYSKKDFSDEMLRIALKNGNVDWVDAY